MRLRVLLAAGSVLAVAVPVAAAGSTPILAARAAGCHPFSTKPVYAGQVPSPRQVLGFPLGHEEISVQEASRYLEAVDQASDRVSVRGFGQSHKGRPLQYAVVGTPSRVRAAKEGARILRDPSTPRDVADKIADISPAILWDAGNVHGDEESGADAAIRVLYQLADRTDCAAKRIRREAVVAVLPIQNPDGRERNWRRNEYAFDLNRDWFARTQPETDGKIEALRRLPPVVFIDDHEMGSDTYFFPPNADPFYHEITDSSISWINDIYAKAIAAEFKRQDIPYFNRDVYDMFYMGYGDTVPTTGFIAAGMTFEKYNGATLHKRVNEQYVAQWATLSAAARHKDEILTGWAREYRAAYRQGERGRLQPNQVINPGNEVQVEVPQTRVRHYFVRADAPGKRAEARALIRRLQRMDVKVRVLTAPLEVPRYTPYGRHPRTVTLPAGTYWVPMAQAQKHWVQAMLNEDTYVPFPYFYDVTAWSQPLLFNVPGGRTGAVLRLKSKSQPAPLLTEPGPPQAPAGPRVGVFQTGPGVYAWQSTNWLRWLFDKKWQLDYRKVTRSGIRNGILSEIDVLVTPGGYAKYAEDDLGQDGRKALRRWVRNGGRYIGWEGSANLAARLGMSTVQMRGPDSDIPGSLLRLRVDPSSPLSRGVGRFAWNMYEYDLVMTATDPTTVALSYPPVKDPDFFVSGFAEGERDLSRTAAVVDEPYGRGRTVLFAAEPNFRGYTDGMQAVLWNAMFGSDPANRPPAPRLAERRAAAAQAADRVTDLSGTMVVSVRPAAAEAVRTVLDRQGVRAHQERVRPGTVRFVVRGVRSAEEDPAVRAVVAELTGLGRGVIAVRVP